MNRKTRIVVVVALALVCGLAASYTLAQQHRPETAPSTAPQLSGPMGTLHGPGAPMGGPGMGPGMIGPMGGPGMPGAESPGMAGGMHHGPGMMPGHPGMAPGMAPGVERASEFLDLIVKFRDVAFDPQTAGMIAIGGMKDDVRRKPDETIKDLEAQLVKTKSLGLRNAIRLTLKDLYKAQGEDDKVLEHLRAMLAENDAAIQSAEKD